MAFENWAREAEIESVRRLQSRNRGQERSRRFTDSDSGTGVECQKKFKKENYCSESETEARSTRRRRHQTRVNGEPVAAADEGKKHDQLVQSEKATVRAGR